MPWMVAYLYPGVGATLTQLLLAGTVGVGVIVKMKWHSVRSFFDRSNPGKDSSSAVVEESPSAAEENEPLE
jgi:hypothetical protein